MAQNLFSYLKMTDIDMWTESLRERFRTYHETSFEHALRQLRSDTDVVLYTVGSNAEGTPYRLQAGQPIVIPRHGDLLVGIAAKSRTQRPLRAYLKVGGLLLADLQFSDAWQMVPPLGAHPLPMIKMGYRLTFLVPEDRDTDADVMFVYALLGDAAASRLALQPAWAVDSIRERVLLFDQGSMCLERYGHLEPAGACVLPRLVASS